ncbi:hypothetical protein TcBrA4_0111930 [Trypanosoma cruzi]|nr:hypothetical protein TcBrA4_0111930 [Trypanosoma cruzi]
MAKGKKSGEAKGTQKRQKKILRRERPWNHPRVHPRLARRGGVKRISGVIYDEVRGVIKSFVEGVVPTPRRTRSTPARRPVTAVDVVNRCASAARSCTATREDPHVRGISRGGWTGGNAMPPATIDRLATGIGREQDTWGCTADGHT